MIDGLDALLNASEEEKEARGIKYTPREIIQQPASWRKTFQIFQERQSDLRQFLIESGFDLRKSSGNPTVILVGAGSSDYVGRALTYLLRRMWGCEVWTVPSTDLLINLEDLVFSEHKYLWISFSRSGDSSEGLAVIEAAIEKYPQVRHLLVTCNESGRMAEICAKARLCILGCFGPVRQRSRARNDEFLHKHGCCGPVPSPPAFFSVLPGNDFRSLRSGGAIPRARSRNSTVNGTGRVFQGLFCGIRRTTRCSAGVRIETTGNDCGKDTNDVRVDSRASAWPYVRAGQKYIVRELSFWG